MQYSAAGPTGQDRGHLKSYTGWLVLDQEVTPEVASSCLEDAGAERGDMWQLADPFFPAGHPRPQLGPEGVVFPTYQSQGKDCQLFYVSRYPMYQVQGNIFSPFC